MDGEEKSVLGKKKGTAFTTGRVDDGIVKITGTIAELT